MKVFSILLTFLLLIVGAQQSFSQIQWHNPMIEETPPIHGRAWNAEIGSNYHRLPARAEQSVRTPLWDLSKQSAGLYLKFYTNASQIKVRYKPKGGHSMPHMPATGVSGVDLYTTDCNGNKAWCAGSFSFADTIQYNYDQLDYHNTHQQGNEFQLFLPLYNAVEWMHIGVSEGAAFSFIQPSYEKPIIIYGTSIAQGACASRPGMAWTNIVQRRTEYPIINLGFSGNGQLEENLFHLLAEIDTRIYAIDCMPNMVDERVTLIYDRIIKGIEILRKKSSSPILLVEHDGYMGEKASAEKKERFEATNRELQRVYQQLLSEGVSDLYYLSHQELALTMDSQVDGVHTSDLGMQQYGDAYTKKIKEILPLSSLPSAFTPCVQRREPGSYEWNERYEQILKFNAEHQPDIVMIGNSITHYWGGNPIASRQSGSKSWKQLFDKKQVVNMGYGWDRIENVMWRIQHGELDGFCAKKIFVMLGTNNLEKDSNEKIIAGIFETAQMIRLTQPAAELYIMHIYPRRGMESRIAQINTALAGKMQNIGNVQVIDVSSGLTDRHGQIIEKYFSDGLHPNEEGYDVIAKNINPYL